MHESFLIRVLAAVSFLAAVSAVELLLRGAASTRWRGSLLILISGAVGALFGMAFDALTSSISPAYFAIGKGLGWENLECAVQALGVQAGASVGVVIGCTISYVSARRSIPFARGLICLTAPIAGAVFFATVGAGVTGFGPWADWAAPFGLYPSEREPFVTVWLMHTGAYLGGACGTGIGLWWVEPSPSATALLCPTPSST